MLGINAVKGFEYGSGFDGTEKEEANTMTCSILTDHTKQFVWRDSRWD